MPNQHSELWKVLEQYPDLTRSQVPQKYAQRLTENYVPDVEEAEEIKAFAEQINQRTSLISEQMAVLDARIKELKLQHTKVLQERAPYQALASASRRLPDAILQRIFVECLLKTRNAAMHKAEAPLLLGRVCSRWRTLAYATPELWARLHIVPPHAHPDIRKSEILFLKKRDVVQEWLARSGDQPLHLSFVWFGQASEETTRLNAILLNALMPLSKRWRELNVQAPMVLLTPFYDLSQEDVPILRTISLMGSRGSDLLMDGSCGMTGPGVSDIINLVGRAPHLRELSLAFNISDTLPLTSIPWTHLQVLYLESNVSFFFGDFNEMAEALAQCRELRSLSLKYPINQTELLPSFEQPKRGKIVLPNLEMFCVDGDQHLRNAFDMAATFGCFVTPKLEDLAILGRPPRHLSTLVSAVNATELLAGVRDLLKSSNCPLQRLKLESIALKTDIFFECLGLSPQLEELTVYSYFCRATVDPTNGGMMEQSLDSALLKLLTPKPTSSPDKPSVLCPRLKSFDYTLSDVDEHLFRQFVESRSGTDLEPGIAKLLSVKTSLKGRETKEVKQWIMDVRSRGTELTLSYHSSVPEDVDPSPWSGVAGIN